MEATTTAGEAAAPESTTAAAEGSAAKAVHGADATGIESMPNQSGGRNTSS
jgi:hypothetical protein